MAVQLNHTILSARNRQESADFLTGILGLSEPVPSEPFLAVPLSNGVTLDVLEVSEPIASQHYAFLVEESEFDEILGRIRQQELPYWADPFHRRPSQVNDWHGGHGVYFDDPNGHRLEVLTRPSTTNR
ncbi:VOC family protein [Peterkaempfera bronchialis]|uniref:VOC family protein n=1 Tax=Peterkaempfera bronchialis TaxID=2126346 RepID=A0A345SXN4_9ACTN|nr:VOC family protein [Peterkaempfera bronchialis]AXI78489.1 VOC family protein [Peterkaempfera bronchialis]